MLVPPASGNSADVSSFLLPFEMTRLSRTDDMVLCFDDEEWKQKGGKLTIDGLIAGRFVEMAVLPGPRRPLVRGRSRSSPMRYVTVDHYCTPVMCLWPLRERMTRLSSWQCSAVQCSADSQPRAPPLHHASIGPPSRGLLCNMTEFFYSSITPAAGTCTHRTG